MFSPADGISYRVAEAATVEQTWRSPRELVLHRPRSKQRAEVQSDSTRRTLNVAVAMFGLIAAAPLMVLIAILVKLTSPGPVLYRQSRIGIDRRRGEGGNWRRQVDFGGKVFTIYKFRTMYVPSRPDVEQAWATPGDPRVTRIGRILRKLRLDELPQLVNVLRGEMNVVGPRPEQPKIFADLRMQIAGYQDRQRVLPGITGWAQINHHYDQNIDDVRRKVAYDLEYTRRQSALEDLKIMALTIPVIVLRKGAW